VQIVEPLVQRQQLVPGPQPVEPMVQEQPEVSLVYRNHDADEVVRNVQQQNFGAHNIITTLVEKIMAENGLNVGLHRPNLVSPLSELKVRKTQEGGLNCVRFFSRFLLS
jgi:hypothetical protein